MASTDKRAAHERSSRAERRERQAAEVEASQANLRKNIAETKRLVGESDEMLKRHRKECEDEDSSS